jgi:hypothetical protein
MAGGTRLQCPVGWQAAAAAAGGVRAGADEGKRDHGSPNEEPIVKTTIRIRGLFVKNRIAINSRDPNQGVLCK